MDDYDIDQYYCGGCGEATQHCTCPDLPEKGNPVATPVKARPTDPFATEIPGRNKKFKTHRTLGQAKGALALHLKRDPAKRVDRSVGWHEWSYGQSSDGVFTATMTVFRLDPDRGEYLPWITVNRGDRRSAFPDLMPKRPSR